jgi:hypothetical protein
MEKFWRHFLLSFHLGTMLLTFSFTSIAGLPDGVFSYQKYSFLYIFEGLGKETFGIFHDHLVYFIGTYLVHVMDIW